MAESVCVVTGGLGYIGQSIAAALDARGESPVILDRRGIPSQVAGIPVIRGDIADPAAWAQLHGRKVRAVFHCAGLIQVGESVSDPAQYFKDNVAAGISMLEHIRALGRIPVVFSSSAAVYGAPSRIPIAETDDLQPLSPYGVTKRQFEEILASYESAYGQPYVALRYFNAAGIWGPVRENHEPESHLLPRLAAWLREGQAPVIYGRDYPTKDGTTVRDYIHVRDLAEAHLAARDYLEGGGASTAINLGSGRGASILEVLSCFAPWVGDMAEPTCSGRRPGDPAVLIADISRAQKLLKWEPVHSDIRDIVRDIWQGGVSSS